MGKIKELQIFKHIIYHLIKEYKDSGKIWHIDEIVSFIVAVTFPFCKKIEFETRDELIKNGTIQDIQKYFEKFIQKNKKFREVANGLTFESLQSYLGDIFTQSLSFGFKKEIVNQLRIASSIEDTGYISIKYSDIACNHVLEHYYDFHTLNAIYGGTIYKRVDEEIDFIKREEISSTSASTKTTDRVLENPTNNNDLLNISCKNSEVLKDSPIISNCEKQNKDADSLKNRLCRIYNLMVEARGGTDGVKKLEYIWEWKISHKEYESICNIVSECSELDNKGQKIIFENINSVFVLAVYVAERYKREWSGNDGSDNAVEKMGIKSKSLATSFFNTLKKRPELICQYESGKGNAWLDSLRMEGGLPLKYIISSNSTLSKFAKELWHDSDSAIEYLTEKTKNQTLKFSYESKFSVYKFVNKLKDSIDNLSNVFNEDDLNSELIVEFAKILNKEKIKARESKKFTLKYNIWKFFHEFVIYRNIVLKSAEIFEETNELISKERITEQWGIIPTYVFKLEIGGKKYLFTPWKVENKDYYRSATGITEFPLSPIKGPNFHLTEEDIYYIPIDEDGEEGGKISICHFKDEDSYLKFSSDNKLNWNSGSRMKHSAILLTKDCKINGHLNEVVELGHNLKWVEDYDHITIDGKDIYADKFSVLAFPTAFHKFTKQSFIRNIEYSEGKNREKLLILDSTQIKGDKFYRQDCEENNIVFNRNSKIEYKLPQRNQYIEFDCENPPQGYTRLRIDGISFDAYLLPPNLSIKRKITETNGSITIIGFNYRVEDSWVKVDKNIIIDTYNENNQNKEVIKLVLNEELFLEIVRPLKREDNILNNQILKANEIIPIKFASKYKKRIFDENGIQYIEGCNTTELYTNEIKENTGFYYITKTEKNLEFVYITIDSNNKLQEMPLSIKDKEMPELCNCEYKYIKEHSPNDTGIIIQSLENQSTELTYYKPQLIGNDINKRLRHVSVLDRIRTTMKHRLYFDVLFNKDEIIPQFVISYCNDCKNEKTDIDWSVLWDIAQYFNIDWLLFCRDEWRKVAMKKENEKREWIKELFRNGPNANILNHFIDKYWELKPYKNNRKILGKSSFLGKLLYNKGLAGGTWPEKIEKIEEEAKELI